MTRPCEDLPAFDPKWLARALWHGPLADPSAPAQELATAISTGLGYQQALASLKALARFLLPVEPALSVALQRWPWSIDLGLTAAKSGRPGGLEILARRVQAEKRRFGALARALWEAGACETARAVLDPLPLASASLLEDLSARFDLALAAGDFPAAAADLERLQPLLPLPALEKAKLRLLYAREGAAALGEAFAKSPPRSLAAWAWAFGIWLAERDFPRARATLATLSQLRAGHGEEQILDSLSLALASEDLTRAEEAVSRLPPSEPWAWPARRHRVVHELWLAQADLSPEPQPILARVADAAMRAQRLYPRARALRACAWTAAERLGDWDALAARLTAVDDPEAALALARLGIVALDRARPSCPLPPNAKAAAAQRLCALALVAGAPEQALAELDAAGPPASSALAASLAEWRAEALLMLRRADEAEATLAPARARHPTRFGLWLQTARAAFFRGAFNEAEEALKRFRALKAEQLGAEPALDLRDLITDDAKAWSLPLPSATGPAPGSPGPAALWLAQRGVLPRFAPLPARAEEIPRLLTHYWEGPLCGPPARGARIWQERHPSFRQHLFDRAAAEAWLARHDPEARAAFSVQELPAARADIFRLAWLVQKGGVWADLDEYPRAPIDEWLAEAAAVFVIESGYGTIANNFIAAQPGFGALSWARAEVLARAVRPTQNPWWDTGPARLTVAVARALHAPGLRLIEQAAYSARVTTNLPFPHKRRPGHWRPRVSGARGRSSSPEPDEASGHEQSRLG